jgi:hypothetical protein
MHGIILSFTSSVEKKKGIKIINRLFSSLEITIKYFKSWSIRKNLMLRKESFMTYEKVLELNELLI